MQPLLDIDIRSEISPENEALIADSPGAEENATTERDHNTNVEPSASTEREEISGPLGRVQREGTASHVDQKSAHISLATPAVRHLAKEHDLDITTINGTGKDGRVLKEDILHHVNSSTQPIPTPSTPPTQDRTVPLNPIQTQMFRTMTRSLSIPHFLYTSTVDTTSLTALREKLNRTRSPPDRLTPLPFILKAVSLALTHHPLLNAFLSVPEDGDSRSSTEHGNGKPTLTFRGSHDFGVAVDTPQGLLVPVVRGVQHLSVAELSAQLRDLSAAAREGKLAGKDLQGASFSVSNIGSIGGGVVAPVIVAPQVAIVGVGRARWVPGFDELGIVGRREEVVLSWSADHRVVDGAECARCAERVRGLLEGVEGWVLEMR